MEITTRQLMDRSGATRRQIDYWCMTNVIPYIQNPNAVRLNKILFNEEIITRVALLVKVSRAFGGNVNTILLGRIFARYEEGYFALDDGLLLTWDVENEGNT